MVIVVVLRVYSLFLGAFAKLRKAAIASSYLSVCPRGTTRPTLDGVLWNLIFEDFFENLSRIFKFFQNITSIKSTLHEEQYIRGLEL